MTPTSSRYPRLARVAPLCNTVSCVALLLIGLAFNEWTIPMLVESEDGLPSTRIKTVVRAFNVIAVLWSLLSFAMRRQLWVFKMNVLLGLAAFTLPLAGELMLRMAIAVDSGDLRRPGLYADEFAEDEFWKLYYAWDGRYKPPAANRVHATLGWSQGVVDDSNPLGLGPTPLAQLQNTERRKVFFYGDSFVKGSSERDHWIPVYMNARLESAEVVDLGVAGFGTDQILLMFEATHQRTDVEHVLMGVFLRDLDRAALSVRVAPKPHFTLASDRKLELRGVPLDQDPAAFFDEHPAAIGSYVYRLARMKLRSAYRRQFKTEVNHRIVARIQRACERADQPLTYILFYTESELWKRSWREDVLKQALSSRSIRWIDTKPTLLRHAKENDLPTRAFYAEDGHHNNLGNAVIGEAILAELRRLGIE